MLVVMRKRGEAVLGQESQQLFAGGDVLETADFSQLSQLGIQIDIGVEFGRRIEPFSRAVLAVVLFGNQPEASNASRTCSMEVNSS
ncbi:MULTISPECIES: hypothetical protein [Halomonadaceae]|uniref:hypothetical protein n=1 Tax=Halomonadaceae TaxID=28256 RepID=UPI00159B676E|nr:MULTISPECIES: hypothetical protein [Halomonas]QJQ96039.1 hypothetical protein HIO72_12670 [Halomonas sp. PA5]